MSIERAASRSYCDPFSRYLFFLPIILSQEFPQLPDESVTPEAVHEEASAWTRHGIRLMALGGREALLEAQVCFEQAIALRQTLPLAENSLYRWGLSAGWMNRADALTRLGTPERLKTALACYDQALHHLHELPLDADPAFLWRLALAWVNRGLTLQKLGDPELADSALRHFDTALQVMQAHADSPRPDYQQVQAVAWMNRALALLELKAAPMPDAALAAASARCALHHASRCPEGDCLVHEVQLKARHTLCRALALLLESPQAAADPQQAEAWIHEATDMVEAVLSLTKDDITHQPLWDELFHFGCRIYRAFQPHFLAGYLEDSFTQAATPTVAMRQAAGEALQQAVGQMQGEGMACLHAGELDKLLTTLQSLHRTGQKLGL